MKLVNSRFYNAPDAPTIMGGAIAKDQIFPVLTVVAEICAEVGITFEQPIGDCLLGSTGKKDISGDIDLGVMPFSAEAALKLKQHPEVLKMTRAGATTSIILTIPGCPEIYEPKNMNGLVQVDLIPGELSWLKQFFYADERSAFKGAHRNLLISAYLMSFRTQTKRLGWSVWETETGPFFSQIHGVAERKLTRLAKPNGEPYATKFDEVILSQCFNIEAAAEHYLGSCYRNAFTSLETLYEAIEENYDARFAHSVYHRFLNDFLAPHLNSDEYPWEIVPHVARCRK